MGMFDFFGMADNYEQRKVANHQEGDLEIDTCAVTDNYEFPYETAVEHPAYNDGKWVIVEQYKDKESAKKGHDKWVKSLTKKLPAELKDVSTCEIAQLAKAFGDEKFTFKKKE